MHSYFLGLNLAGDSFFHRSKNFIFRLEFLIKLTLAEDRVLILAQAFIHHDAVDTLLLEEVAQDEEAINVDEDGFGEINADALNIGLVDFIEDLGLKVEAVDVVEGAVELNLHGFFIVLNMHAGLAGLLRLLEEAEEGTDHETNSTVKEHTDEPGHDQDPELKFVNVPQLSHNGLWYQSAGRGDQNGSDDTKWNVRENWHEDTDSEQHEDSVDELRGLVSGSSLDIDVGTDEHTSAWGAAKESADHVGNGHTKDFLGLVESSVRLVVGNSGRDQSLKNGNESNLKGTRKNQHFADFLFWCPVSKVPELNITKILEYWVFISEHVWSLIFIVNNFLHDDTMDYTKSSNDNDPWN